MKLGNISPPFLVLTGMHGQFVFNLILVTTIKWIKSFYFYYIISSCKLNAGINLIYYLVYLNIYFNGNFNIIIAEYIPITSNSINFLPNLFMCLKTCTAPPFMNYLCFLDDYSGDNLLRPAGKNTCLKIYILSEDAVNKFIIFLGQFMKDF